jgi:hypothetical protein
MLFPSKNRPCKSMGSGNSNDQNLIELGAFHSKMGTETKRTY